MTNNALGLLEMAILLAGVSEADLAFLRADELNNETASFCLSPATGDDLTEALQAFDNATALDPKSAFSWKVKGYALKALGHVSELEVAFSRAVELGYEG